MTTFTFPIVNFNQSAIIELRSLHDEIMEAVLESYHNPRSPSRRDLAERGLVILFDKAIENTVQAMHITGFEDPKRGRVS